MTATALPPTFHVARDEITHTVLTLAAYTRRLSRVYNTQGRPIAQLDGRTPPYTVTMALTSLDQFGMIHWDRERGSTGREIAQANTVGDAMLALWERELFRGISA